ncbi:MAG: hypothetical protein KIH08_09520 [Candidatus Freyarchaeota archaeon]|nr:hypothetical protein [Candidatus Jordarchaeia archaeon]MBS7268238.1 hypothetical protein [Candidatus Jordarchaeia archaeon]MBS7281387.1 hypothetical protein [Candidatus Jordarchaeia archaeon]
MMVSWNKIFDFFRLPDESVAEKILRDIGVFECDEGYKELKTSLTNLVGRKSREPSFCEFFCGLSKLLFKKIKSELAKRIEKAREEAYNEASREFGKQIARAKEQWVMEAFSQDILLISDPPTYRILKILYQEGERSLHSLKRTLNLEDGELKRRINYLKDLELIKSHYNNCEEYTISEIGEKILERRGAEFEKMISMVVDDKAYRLSLEAVGENKVMAHKLENWLKSSRGRRHLPLIQKLKKEENGDPRRISQAFFGRRENGVRHEEHIEIKIVNHKAAGERLLLEIEKNQNEKSNLKTLKYTSLREQNQLATSPA